MIYLTEDGAYDEADFLIMEAAKCESHVRAWNSFCCEERKREEERRNLEHWSQFW